ncbi:hypothetical protein MFFC18_23080 [Mariniblastus fucicola]|uniref:Uncharacterized protein n=1 Tax=Mariniblastus fucicola TaxID=980251 RepID=A0A5B9P806_9BACT|nr:hypothetical protein MFFC18_23080 [Mariniblastus fucicola]
MVNAKIKPYVREEGSGTALMEKLVESYAPWEELLVIQLSTSAIAQDRRTPVSC